MSLSQLLSFDDWLVEITLSVFESDLHAFDFVGKFFIFVSGFFQIGA